MKPPFLFSFNLIILLHPFISKAQSIENIQPVPANLHVDSVLHLPTHTSDMKFVIPWKITFNLDVEKDILESTVVSASTYANLDVVERKAHQNKVKHPNKTNESMEEKMNEMLEYYTKHSLAYPLRSFAHENGYSDTVNTILTNQQNSLYLHGKVTRIFDANFINDRAKRLATSKLYITWSIHNIYGECIDSVQTIRYGDYSLNLAHYLYIQERGLRFFLQYDTAIKNGYIALINHPQFKPYLSIDTVNPNQQLPVLTIPSPTKPVSSIEDALTATVTIKRSDKGHGSGFAISNDGYVLTNYHVIAGDFINQPDSFMVLTPEGTAMPAKLIRIDKLHDIALLKVDQTFKSAFLLNSTKSYSRMMEVYTIGTPSSVDLGQSVSKGILSNERKTDKVNLLQLGISLNAGNSGGPIFEKTGQLHGVVVSKLVGFATEGISFAIPAYLIPSYLNLQVK